MIKICSRLLLTLLAGLLCGSPSPLVAQTLAQACPVTFDCFGFDGEPGGERLCGSDQTDTDLYGTAAGERLCGRLGDDQMSGGDGDDRVHGNQGNDLVKGNEGNDRVRGGKGDDEVRGGRGNDSVYGDEGTDHLWGDLGDDVLFGGAGNDVYHYRPGDGDDVVDDTDGTNVLLLHQFEDGQFSTWQEGINCEVSLRSEEAVGSVIFLNQECELLQVSVIGGPCVADQTTLCLQEGRFQVQARWRDFNGAVGPGRVVPVDSPDSGLFWFFDSTNWEVLIKVLDGCDYNGHFWAYSAATTDVEYSLTLTDLELGTTASYSNTLGVSSGAINDSLAFPGCP